MPTPAAHDAEHRSVWIFGGTILFIGVAWLLQGCKPDDAPLKVENRTLQKQLNKQDSVILSLQEGNKVMQQQINLLNGELREAEKKTEATETERQKLLATLQALTAQNRKLATQAKRARAKSARAAKAIRVEDKGAQTRELLHPLAAASKAAEEALAQNGYVLRVSVKTETRAVFVTERKVSAPASLEVAGFRNQYFVSLHALPTEGTLLSVKADFEKTGQAGGVVPAGPDETAEIEGRLIVEISKNLANSRTHES